MMDMPITIEITDLVRTESIFREVFNYFKYIDDKFSTFKEKSEITKVNNGLLKKDKWSRDMKEVIRLCERTKKETNGYFDISKDGKLDPSGLVKGWAVYNAADYLKKEGFKNFYVEAGGDIQAYGRNKENSEWTIGIRNPFNRNEIVKVLRVSDKGVATSGTYIRGQHIYNPFKRKEEIKDIVSLTVVGPNVFEADRFATAAFAMGKEGINFIENLSGFEGYMIDSKGMGTFTSGFKSFV